MTRQDPDPITRLGPDSGGRVPGEPAVRSYSWDWNPGEGRRTGLPWIGIFLLVFGGLLLIEQLVPGARSLGSLAVLAVGIAFLIKWAMDRGTGSLYAGAIITALAAPGVLNAVGIQGNGLGTFCLGVAFLAIAAVRYTSGGGWGWQLWFGGLLALVGAVNLTTPGAGSLIVPAALVVLGALLIVSGIGGRRRA
jgi:hypothetical protein